LEVSRSGNFTGGTDTAASPTTYATSWIAPTTLDLANAGELWYRVSAYGTGTTESTRGEPSTPQLLGRDALAAPTLLAPADDATINYPTAVAFSWSPIAGAVSYEVEYVAGEFASSSATPVTATTTATTLVPQKPLTPGLGYQWRVRSNFYNGSTTTSVPGPSSAPRSFTVRWPAAASQPTLVSPANSGSDPIVSDPQLRWEPVAGAKNYQVLLGRSKDSAGNIVSPTVATVTGTAYIPRMAFSNTNYFWQVVANDANGGAGTPSQVWQFKKALSYSAAATTTGAPVEVYPEPLTGSADSGNPAEIPLDGLELKWEPVPRATLYEVQVVPTNGDPRLTCRTASTSATIVGALIPTGTEKDRLKGAGDCFWTTRYADRIRPRVTYTWRVRAVDYLGSATTGTQSVVPDTAITSEWSDEEVEGQESRERWFVVAQPEPNTNTAVTLDLDDFEAQKDDALQGQPAPALTWQPFDFSTVTDETARVGYEVTVYAKGVGSSTQVAVVRTPSTRLRINGVLDDNEVAEPYSASVRPFVLKSISTNWTTTTDISYVSGHSADRYVWTKTSKTVDVSTGPQSLADGTTVLTWTPQFATAPLDGGSRGYAITIRDSAESVVGTAGYKADLPFLVAQTYSSQSDSAGKPLPQGNYTYEVAPLDANGNATRYSGREPFTIGFPSPSVGSAPASVGASQAVTWSPSTAAFKYQLRYKPASAATSTWATIGTTSTALGTTDPVQGGYVFTDLAPGEYVWQLRSVDTAGNVSAWSPEQAFTIGGPPLEQLTPDQDVLPVVNRVLRWNPVTGASRYVVEVSTNANLASAASYETIATALAVPTSVTAGTAYYWRVKAVPEIATTSSTRPVLATSTTRSFSVRTVPAAVKSVKAIADGTSLQVSWAALTGADAGSAEAPQYVIQVRQKGLGDDWSGAQTVTTAAAATSSLMSGLASSTSYEARVSALNSEGQGPWSAVVAATTASAPSAAPSSLKVTQGLGSLTVSWRAPTGTGTGGSPITGYSLRYRTGDGAWSQVTLGAATTSYLLSLAANTQYAIEIAAVNAIGTGPAATATATTLGAPGMVSSFTVVRGDRSARLAWSAPASNGGSTVTGYLVQQRSYNATTKVWSAWASATVTTTSRTATGLANGTQYQFRVAARTALATGAYSAELSATPAGKPGASPKLTVKATKGKFTLSWKAAPNNGAALTSYVVQYSSNGKTWKTVKTTSGSVLKLTTTVGKKGKTYSFRVVAKNAVGTGSYSKAVKAKRK
ncbi:MAG: fibronectin type III domain-containing protein, partial [Propionicimonas sp.]|nr:fibronectin type III domain-containing protein [Propionicimonas sp.]